MSDAGLSLEERVTLLTAQLTALDKRVRQLEGESAPATLPRHQPTAAAPEPAVATHPILDAEGEDISEEVLSWASKAALLPRLATLCFLLVIALALRTVTDNQLLNTLAGSASGIAYAGSLIAAGWFLYHRQSPLAPVFAALGALLMGTIVVETHMRFQSLPLVPAYLTLMATGIAMTAISHLFKAFLPVSVGTLAMCLAGAAIDYPHPFFPYLSMILWTANLLGYYAASLKRCSWLRWTVLAVTLVMLQLWGLRLGLALLRHETPAPELAPQWFLPVLMVFALTYPAIAIMGILRSGAGRVSRFDFSLPTVNAIWVVSVAQFVLGAWNQPRPLLGGIALAFAAGHGGIAFWLAGRHVVGAPGTNSQVFAGAVFLAFGLPMLTGDPLIGAPLLAAAACGLALLGQRWQSGGVRFTSYLLQAYAMAILVTQLLPASPETTLPVALAASACLAGISLYHYRWCRQTPPPETSHIFSQLDERDLSAAIPLLAALVNGFFMARVVLGTLLPNLPGVAGSAFRCSQSLLINLAAIGLMLLASRRRNKELRNIAILVMVVGGAKVFLADLIGTKGVPLVLSVFSFGLAAAIVSLILGRWPRQSAGDAATSETSHSAT